MWDVWFHYQIVYSNIEHLSNIDEIMSEGYPMLHLEIGPIAQIFPWLYDFKNITIEHSAVTVGSKDFSILFTKQVFFF